MTLFSEEVLLLIHHIGNQYSREFALTLIHFAAYRSPKPIGKNRTFRKHVILPKRRTIVKRALEVNSFIFI